MNNEIMIAREKFIRGLILELQKLNQRLIRGYDATPTSNLEKRLRINMVSTVICGNINMFDTILCNLHEERGVTAYNTIIKNFNSNKINEEVENVLE